jgi:SAM-dependent methyltransferase
VLADVVPLLRCPHCGATFEQRDGVLACGGGHTFDVARQGYVNLLPRPPRTGTGDSPAMVQARDSFLGRGHYAPFADAVAAGVNEVGSLDEPVAEIGAGTAYHLARVVEGRTGPGLALDVSTAAARRAARAHPRVGSVVADAWTSLPVADACVGAAVVAFAPRAGGEVARILRPGGRLAVLVPGPDHLIELRSMLGLLDVDPRKTERLAATLGAAFAPVEEREVRWTAHLDRSDVRDLVLMGPNARHQDVCSLERQLRSVPDHLAVTVSGSVHLFARA